jgi:hypothetical protein
MYIYREVYVRLYVLCLRVQCMVNTNLITYFYLILEFISKLFFQIYSNNINLAALCARALRAPVILGYFDYILRLCIFIT